MEICADFHEEETMLQAMAHQMGLEVDCSPKCHCKLMGKEIEYAWGCAKNCYRRLLLEKKNGRNNFIASVRESISRNNVTRLRVQKFVKARWYVAGYHILWQMEEGAINNMESKQVAESKSNLAILPVKCEQMVLRFKTHRCAMDFDHSLCKSIYSKAQD